MRRIFDHIDLRVPDLAEAGRFYSVLLPALGFVRQMEVEGWLQWETDPEGEFFGMTESSRHVPNENRIAFRAESDEAVDRLAEAAARAGARNVEGPMAYEPGYRAVFFEDPFGNRLEVCHRVTPPAEGRD